MGGIIKHWEAVAASSEKYKKMLLKYAFMVHKSCAWEIVSNFSINCTKSQGLSGLHY